MQDHRWQRIKDLFAEAGALPPDRRDDFLRGAEPDATIRAEVSSLLAAHSPTLAPAGSGTASETKAGGRIGPYKLLEVIGEGTFGTVYVAEQEAPVRRRVALKIVKAGMDSREVVARFEQERQALALMDHPNIARVFDGGSTPNGRPFFVMELVKGDPITEYCDREKLTPVERLRLFADVGRAVQHAHQKGVIHRDLKPSNVLVTLIDGKAIAKVIDFGVAKATQGRLTDKTLFTEHKQMIGTPLYMSPEQAHISGVDVDTRSDVYSLGVLLYELLTGTTPFRKEELLAADLTEMHRVLREVEPQKPSTRVATLGKTSGLVAAQRRVEVAKLGAMLRGDLDWIVMKCLEKERARRYETASDLVKDVERHLAGEAVLAAPPSLGYRVRKFVQRHRARVVAAATVVVVALVGLVAFAWSQQKGAEQAKQFAEQGKRFATEQESEAYARRIRAAEAALASLDVKTVRKHLDDCPEHLRHWEWNYLDAASDRSEFVLAGHQGPVRFVAYDDRGERLVTASDDGTARLWDPRTGASLGALVHGKAAVRKALFHPSEPWLATITEADEILVWDTRDRTKVATLVACPGPHTDDDRPHRCDFAWRPDGRQIATVVRDGATTLWGVGEWKVARVLQAESRHDRVLFAPATARLVTWSPFRAPVLWDADSGARVARIEGLKSSVESLSIDAGLLRVLTDGSSSQWSIATGERAGGRRWPRSIAWIGSTLDLDIGTDRSGVVTLGGETGSYDLVGHRGEVVHAAAWNDGVDVRAVTASADRTARLWRGLPPSAPREVALFLGHTAPITYATLRADSRQYATASEDHTCRLWNLQHTWERRREIATDNFFNGLAFSPDGLRLLVRAESIQLTNLETMQADGTAHVVAGSIGPVSAPRVAAWCGSDTIASVPSLTLYEAPGMTARATVADGASGVLKYAVGSATHVLVAHAGDVAAFDVRTLARATPSTIQTFSSRAPQGRSRRYADLDPARARMVVARTDQSVQVLDLGDGAVTCTVAPGPGELVGVHFRPDGEQFVVASTQGAQLRASSTGALVAELPPGIHYDPIWSRNGARIATWSSAGIRVCDARTGRQLCIVHPTIEALQPHPLEDFPRSKFDLSPDGARLLVCWTDAGEMPSIWDATTGRELLRLRTPGGPGDFQGCFSPDGSQIAIGASNARTVTLFEGKRLSLRLGAVRGRLSDHISPARSVDPLESGRGRTTLLDHARELLEAVAAGAANTEQLAECCTALGDALTASPDDSFLRAFHGLLSYHVGAYADCARDLANNDLLPIYLSYMTMALCRLGRQSEADAVLTKLEKFDPDSLEWAMLGLSVQDMLSQARTVFAECFPEVDRSSTSGK